MAARPLTKASGPQQGPLSSAVMAENGGASVLWGGGGLLFPRRNAAGVGHWELRHRSHLPGNGVSTRSLQDTSNDGGANPDLVKSPVTFW